jgi:hypothetical protein
VVVHLGCNVHLNILDRRAIVFSMAASSNIIDLRKLLAERFPQIPAVATTRLSTGLPLLDQAINGGLPKGTITELTSPRVSAGSASLIHALLQSAARNHYFVALIDGRDSFDPGALHQSSLRHLLWVRCTKAFEAIKAADLLLRDGNFALAIVDLVLNPVEELRKIPQTSWYRLQRLIEPVPIACLILTRHRIVGSAQLKIVLENSWSLENFEDENALSQLRIRVERSHLRWVFGRDIARCPDVAARHPYLFGGH